MENVTTVNFFKEGFFGYSDQIDFQMGSIWHILPIAIMIITIFLIYKFRKQIKEFKYEETIRYILAFVMLMAEMTFFWRLLYVGNQGTSDTMFTYFPFQMCQWGLILCVFTIISKNQKLFSINFFITLAFATIALIYPLVISHTGPTYYRYYQFWLEHILPIISVFYLMFVHGLKLDYKGIYRAIIAIIPLACVAVIANELIPNANYLYLKLKVPFLPDNQLAKIPFLCILVLILFHLMYFIYYKLNNKRKKGGKNEKS